MMDDLLLEEVDNEIAAQPIEPEDGDGYIRSVRVTNAWKHFRKQFAADMSMEEPQEKKFARNYVQWTPEMDRALLDVLVEHHNNGDHAQNGWKSHVYRHAIKDVREKCGVEVTKEKIVSRCKTFDKHYEIVSKILSQSGFGWDWEKNVLVMDGDDVWDKYVEVPAIYKNKVIHNWNEICTIYSKDHATGQGARTGAETEVEVAPTAQEATDISRDLVGPSPKRPRMGEAIMCMLGDVKTSFSDAMKSTESAQGTPPSVILAALEEIPDLYRAEKLRGYAKLVHSERSFHALLELPMDDRKEWLMMLV
ncbi:unnamed protein product [Alopecurus aequalis]